MASLSGSGDRDERGVGGKLPSQPRPLPLLPYARPERPQPRSRSPSWFSGLISGAGKLISSVFGFQSSSPSSSSSFSSGESDASDVEKNQGQRSERFINCRRGPVAIVPKNETKLAIEEFLTHETFSRDECDRLIKMIQSRIIDSPPEVTQYGKETDLYINSKSPNSSGTWQSAGQQRKRLSISSYNTCNLNGCSPGFSAHHIYLPDLRATAVKEAKKWFEERKSTSSSKLDLDCGQCVLNTDMLHHDVLEESGSPVDMAKAYMCSLPPWQSPPFANIGVKTPSSDGMHLYNDETLTTTSTCSLPILNFHGRNYLAVGPCDSLDENNSSPPKSTKDIFDIHKPRQADSSEGLLGHGTLRISSLADKTDCSGGNVNMHVEKPTGAGQQTTTEKPTSNEHTQSDIGRKTRLPDPNVLKLGGNQELERHTSLKLQVGNITDDSFVVSSLLLEHAGNKLLEEEEVSLDGTTSTIPSMQSNFRTGGLSQTEDSRPIDWSTQLQKPNRWITNISTKDPSRESDKYTHLEPIRTGAYFMRSSIGGLATSISQGSSEGVPVNERNSVAHISNDSTKQKPMEQVLAKPQIDVVRRGRKQVVCKSRKGKGYH